MNRNIFTIESAVSILRRNGFRIQDNIIISHGASGTMKTGSAIDYLTKKHDYRLQVLQIGR